MLHLADEGEGSLDLEPGGRDEFEKQPTKYAIEAAVSWILEYLPTETNPIPSTTQYRLPRLQHKQLDVTTTPTPTNIREVSWSHMQPFVTVPRLF